MALFPQRFISQVQQASDIVEVVGQYVSLKKRGKEFVGLCPFHEDHRPSLYVSPAKQIYKCFACGAGGGVFQFLTQLRKLSFPEVVRELAERAGIPVPAVTEPAGEDRSLSRETLVELCTFAARFYRDGLFSEQGASALAYARGRKLSEESIRRFGLGYAPDSWEALRKAAHQAGFSDRQLLAAGLVSRRDDGSCYDRFRDRLIFPIFDPSGKVIAFGGRALAEGEQAKYLNSPETVLFDKSANLYGLHWARTEMAQTSRAVVVEGYLDALMCLQEGVGSVVATLGTALTARHVQLLGRYAREVVLVFDADTAGQAAAERAIELFLTQRLNVRVATVPQSSGDAGVVKDPCDYVLAAGAEGVRQLLADAPDALEYAWQRRAEAYRQAEALADKRAILEEFLRLVASSAAYGAIDSLREGLLIGHVAELVGLSPRDISAQMRRLRRTVARASGSGQGDASPATEDISDRAERWILGALINAPELFEQVRDKIRPELFQSPVLREVAEQLWLLASRGRPELTDLLGAGQSPQWGRVVTDLQIAAEKRGNYQPTLTQAVDDLLRRQQQQELQELKQQMVTDKDAALREIGSRLRRPDPRRRPKLA